MRYSRRFWDYKAAENQNPNGVMLMAVYCEGVLISVSKSDNKTVSAKIPDTEGDLSVKIMFMKSHTDIMPFTNSVFIRE